jgi:YidC/Oxa1 family membrane protein insertase
MAFYKDNNINPVGGCMPLLFQIPVFLVLYRVILGLTRRATDVGSQFGLVAASVRTGGAPATFEEIERANFNPAYLGEDTKLFEDLANSNEMSSVGVDLARSASSVLGADGITGALPYLLIVLIVGLTGWFQHRMIRSRNTGAVANPTQEMVMKIMPFFLPVFSFSLPAAIVIYFLVSNLYRIGQQWYITYSMYHGDDSLGAQVRKAREETAKQTKAGSKKGSSSKKGDGSKGSTPKAKSNTRSSGRKTTAKTVARSGAPGRNRSGREGSARTQVQPRARKKKKR